MCKYIAILLVFFAINNAWGAVPAKKPTFESDTNQPAGPVKAAAAAASAVQSNVEHQAAETLEKAQKELEEQKKLLEEQKKQLEETAKKAKEKQRQLKSQLKVQQEAAQAAKDELSRRAQAAGTSAEALVAGAKAQVGASAEELITRAKQAGKLGEDVAAGFSKVKKGDTSGVVSSFKKFVGLEQPETSLEKEASALAGKGIGAALDQAKQNPLISKGIDDISKFLDTHPKVKMGLGLLLISVLGLLGGGTGIGVDEGVDHAHRPVINKLKATFGLKDPSASGQLTPSGYAAPDVKDEEYLKAIEDLAANFANIEELLKKALDKNSYYSKTFKILGSANSKDFGLVYEFDSGAGQLGTPVTPFLIGIVPEQINDVAVMADILVGKMSGEAKDLMQALLQPGPELTFAIKYILLVNTVINNSKQTLDERIETILSESTLLYSRLILSTTPITKAAIRTALPKSILDILDQQTTKMFTEMVKTSNDSIENSKIATNVYRMRQEATYKEKVDYAKENIVSLFEKDLTSSDWMLAIHALVRITADLGDKLPKITASKTDTPDLRKEQKAARNKEIDTRTTNLIDLLKNAVTAMKEAEYATSEIEYLEALIKMTEEVKSGVRPIDKIITKPLIGEYKAEFKDISLTKCLDICLRNFNLIYGAKFDGDYDYMPHDLLYGKNGTRSALLSIFLRGIRGILTSEEILFKTKETSVLLRLTDGSNFTINPADELEKTIRPAMQYLVKVQKEFGDAIAALRKNTQNIDNQKNYTAAMQKVKDAAQKLLDGTLNFRHKFSVYYPIKQADGSTQTVAEFLQKTIKKLTKQSKFLDNVFEPTYNPFQKIFGFPADMFYENPSVV